MRKRRKVSSTPAPSFIGWWRETSALLKILLAGAASLGILATGVGAFDKLGLEKKILATRDYVDDKIDTNNLPIIGGITDLQLNQASDSLSRTNSKLLDIEIAKTKTRDQGELAKLNFQSEQLKTEREEIQRRIQSLKVKSK